MAVLLCLAFNQFVVERGPQRQNLHFPLSDIVCILIFETDQLPNVGIKTEVQSMHPANLWIAPIK